MVEDKLYIHAKDGGSYGEDCEQVVILGIWDNPHELMTHINKGMSTMFDRIHDIRKENKQYLSEKETYYNSSEYITEVIPNTVYDIAYHELTTSRTWTGDKYKTYEIDEFFTHHVYPSMWKPDPDLVKSHNAEIKMLKDNEYKGKNLKQKLSMFRDLLIELKEHKIIDGTFHVIEKNRPSDYSY